MVRPDCKVEAPPVVILLFAATLAPFDRSSANVDCGVVNRGAVRSVKESRVVAAAENRSWIDDDVACNSSVLELSFEEVYTPLGENAAAPPQTTDAIKTVLKEIILMLLLVACRALHHAQIMPWLFSSLTPDAIFYRGDLSGIYLYERTENLHTNHHFALGKIASNLLAMQL